jgi:hypothetical protein
MGGLPLQDAGGKGGAGVLRLCRNYVTDDVLHTARQTTYIQCLWMFAVLLLQVAACSAVRWSGLVCTQSITLMFVRNCTPCAVTAVCKDNERLFCDNFCNHCP